MKRRLIALASFFAALVAFAGIDPARIDAINKQEQESLASTGLRSECCTGYWMAGTPKSINQGEKR